MTKIIALTGGIACGKSTLGRLLRQELHSLVLFDCDAAVRRLLDDDAAVAASIQEVFGAESVTAEGRVARDFLRRLVFENAEARLKLEAILHPRVRQECLDSLAQAATSGAEWFVADVPLLFETGFDFGQTQVWVIACSPVTQVQRLKARNGFDDDLIASILAAQLPLSEKISRADVVFWNQGPLSLLHAQVRRFAQFFAHESL